MVRLRLSLGLRLEQATMGWKGLGVLLLCLHLHVAPAFLVRSLPGGGAEMEEIDLCLACELQKHKND